VAERVFLSAGRENVRDCVALAEQHGLGIEVMVFAFPEILDGDWERTLKNYKHLLRDVNGVTMHGPFMDMAPGSPDKRINTICVQRYQHAIRIAGELEAEVLVFHANFIAAIHNVEYRTGWHRRNVLFWHDMAEYAAHHDVTLAVENMWEFDPHIIGDVLKEVDHPNLRACLDIGHAHLFTDDEFIFEDWLQTLEPFLVHLHINNNNGRIDVHQGLHDGVLDYHEILARIRALSYQPSITLEMDRVEDMEASLAYFKLKRSTDEFSPVEL